MTHSPDQPEILSYRDYLRRELKLIESLTDEEAGTDADHTIKTMEPHFQRELVDCETVEGRKFQVLGSVERVSPVYGLGNDVDHEDMAKYNAEVRNSIGKACSETMELVVSISGMSPEEKEHVAAIFSAARAELEKPFPKLGTVSRSKS